MNVIQIPSNYKICVSRCAADCIGAGGPELKWRGKVCPNCVKMMNQQYYSTNKKTINKRVVDKRRLQRAEKMQPNDEEI